MNSKLLQPAPQLVPFSPKVQYVIPVIWFLAEHFCEDALQHNPMSYFDVYISAVQV